MLKKEFKFVSEQEINLMYDCSEAAYTLRRMEDERLKEAINILNEKKDAIKSSIMGPINLLKDNLFHFFRIVELNSGENYYLMPYRFVYANNILFTITLRNNRYEYSLKEQNYSPKDFCKSDILIEEIEYDYFMFQTGIGERAPLFYRLKREAEKTKEEIGNESKKQLERILKLSRMDEEMEKKH